LFWSQEAAEAAAQDSCLEFLAEKHIHEGIVKISWRKEVHTNAIMVKEGA
jgi:hypothetical protein